MNETIFTLFLILIFFTICRELKYVTVFPGSQDRYDYYLEQVLPADVYVSTDELSDLMRFNKVGAFDEICLFSIKF